MSEPTTVNRAEALESALRRRIDAGGKAFVPYVTAGLFGVDADLLRGFEDAGADVLEVGVPFSDPVIDGVVIQEASRRALEAGFHPRDAIALVKEASLSIPVVLMTYLNPVLSMGPASFISAALDAGVSGTIIPDLPEDEAADWITDCRQAGLATIFLASPGTSNERLADVADAASGWIYCVTTYGVTGARQALDDVSSRSVVDALRPLTNHPLLVGVGISTPEHARAACEFADGVAVGSALVKPMLDGNFDAALASAREFRAAVPTG